MEADGSIIITMKLKPEGSFLEQKEQIAVAVAEVGRLASHLSVKAHDTDSRPLIVENQKYTSRGVEKKTTKRHRGK